MRWMLFYWLSVIAAFFFGVWFDANNTEPVRLKQEWRATLKDDEVWVRKQTLTKNKGYHGQWTGTANVPECPHCDGVGLILPDWDNYNPSMNPFMRNIYRESDWK